MEPNSNGMTVDLTSEKSDFSDDLYLTEMTDRIQRLRALIAIKEPEYTVPNSHKKSSRKAG